MKLYDRRAIYTFVNLVRQRHSVTVKLYRFHRFTPAATVKIITESTIPDNI